MVGKNGVGLSLSNLSTAVVMLAVVIIALKVTGGTAYAADKIGEITGLCLANPRIGSFSALPAPDGDGSDMEFRFTVRGCTKGTELLIYKSYEAAIDKKPAGVNYVKASLVFHAIKETELTGKKLADLLKSSRLVVVQCPKDGGGRACDENNTKKYLPGQHLFHAVLKRDGKAIDVKEAKANFYTEDYVELLGSAVSGCSDCNVIECKRRKFESLLESNNKCSEGVKLLYRQSGGNVGVVESGCNYPAEPSRQAEPLRNAGLAGCSVQQVDDAHSKTVLSTFYRLACEKGDGIGALADLPEIGSKLGKKGLAVEQVKGMAVSELKECAVKAGEGLKGLGWVSAEAGPGRREAYQKTMGDYLDALQPGVGELSLNNDANGLLIVNWRVPAGILNVKEFRIGHVVTKASDPSDPAKVLSASFPLTKSPAVCEAESRTCAFTVDVARESVAGWHEFSVRAASKVANADGSEYLSNPAMAGRGLYNNRFIELYSRHPNGCNTDKCNVIKKKKELIKSSPKASRVYQTDGVRKSVNDAGCVYDASKGMDECTEPEAVDIMYREIMGNAMYRGVTRAIPPAEFERLAGFPCDESNTPEGRVCTAKSELEEELLKKRWSRVAETSIVITPSNIGIQDFAVAAGSDGSFNADFVVSGDTSKINRFVIEHSFNRFARNNQNQFVNLLPIEAAAGDREAVIGPFEERFDGLHKFRLKALDELSIELGSSGEVAVGIYERDYLELYDGDADDCNGAGGCNVVGKKRDYINREKRTAEELLSQNEGLRNGFAAQGCDIMRVGQCGPEGVELLFRALLQRYFPVEWQQAELLSDCDINTNPYGDICRARKNLEGTLKNKGWVEITNRGQIKDALPTTTVSISTVPETPLPGELFRLVVEARSTHSLRWLKVAEAGSNEWKTVPCDWLSNTCKREFAGLYFEPAPQQVRISVVDVTERVVELPAFTPVAGRSCLGSHEAGDKWAGCLSDVQEEILYECGSDGSLSKIIADKEEERRYSSILCGGIVDYGEAEAGSQGSCIYSCRFDVECSAAGGSVAPFECPGNAVGYSGVELKQVCCDIGLAQEANPKTGAVLAIITDLMNQNIQANSVGGFFFFFDIINPVKMFTEGVMAQERHETLNVMEKLLADAEQGTPLSSVVGTMGTLRKDSREKGIYLDQKYESISSQFYGHVAKLNFDFAYGSSRAVRDKAAAELARLSPLIANFDLFILPQRELDEIAIRHSTDKLVLEIARYDALSWADDDRQVDVLDNVYFEAGQILQSTGDDAIAIELYNLVLDNFPGSEHAQEAEDRISELNSLGHKAKSLTKSIAIDVFGDPFFFLFGGPASLAKGGLTAVKVLSKTPQIAKQGGRFSEIFLRQALEGSGVRSREILEKAPAMLVRSGGAVTQELKELLSIVPRVIKSRMIKTAVDDEGRLFFETTAIRTGAKVRVPYLKSFKAAVELGLKNVDEVKSAYRQLMIEKGVFFINPDDQKLAIRLLQSGLSKDEVFKVVTKADRIADRDELLAKLVNNFLEPEFGIAEPRLAKMVLAAKVTPSAVDDALAIKRAATEVILKTGYKRARFLVAKTPEGAEVRASVSSQLMKGDVAAAVEKAGGKYAEVMRKYPQLLDNAEDQGRVLELVQSEGLSADDIGKLIIRRTAAESAVKQRFLDSFVSKVAPTLDKINDADTVLKSDDFMAAIGTARVERAKEWERVNKLIRRGVRSQVVEKQNKLVQEMLSRAALKGGNAPALEGSLSGAPLDLSKTFYGAYGPIAEGRGVMVVPEHVPTLFNRLVAIKTKASDFAVSAELMAGVASAEAKLFIKTAHAHAVEYATPLLKVAKEKGLKPLNAVVSFDIAKATILSAPDFAALEKIAGAAVPVLVVNPDGSEELAFAVFEEGALPSQLEPQTDALFVPDGSVSYCSYYDVVVDCTYDDEVSRSSIPVQLLTDNTERAVLVSLNMRNLEGFETPKELWLKENVAPLAANIQVDDDALNEEEADALLTVKSNELLSKAGAAYDTAKGFRELGLTDSEVQQLLVSARDISSFNDVKDAHAEKLKVMAG